MTGVEVAAALDALHGVGDPLDILRSIESELSTLGALAEATNGGDAGEFLDIPGALGPTLTAAAQRLGVAIDLLDLAALPKRTKPPAKSPPPEPLN